MRITSFVRKLTWLLPPTSTCDPLPNLEARISFMFHVHVGLFEEKDPNHNTKSKYDRTNQVREEKRELVEDRAAMEQPGVALTWLSQCSTESRAED